MENISSIREYIVEKLVKSTDNSKARNELLAKTYSKMYSVLVDSYGVDIVEANKISFKREIAHFLDLNKYYNPERILYRRYYITSGHIIMVFTDLLLKELENESNNKTLGSYGIDRNLLKSIRNIGTEKEITAGLVQATIACLLRHENVISLFDHEKYTNKLDLFEQFIHDLIVGMYDDTVIIEDEALCVIVEQLGSNINAALAFVLHVFKTTISFDCDIKSGLNLKGLEAKAKFTTNERVQQSKTEILKDVSGENMLKQSKNMVFPFLTTEQDKIMLATSDNKLSTESDNSKELIKANNMRVREEFFNRLKEIYPHECIAQEMYYVDNVLNSISNRVIVKDITKLGDEIAFECASSEKDIKRALDELVTNSNKVSSLMPKFLEQADYSIIDDGEKLMEIMKEFKQLEFTSEPEPYKIYLASSFFDAGGYNKTATVARILREEFGDKIEIYVPQENNSINDKARNVTNEEIYKSDLEWLQKADMLLCDLDGLAIDPGVSCEIGIFSQLCEGDLSKTMIGYVSDMRGTGKGEGRLYRNQFVLGAVQDNGIVIYTNPAEFEKCVRESIVAEITKEIENCM